MQTEFDDPSDDDSLKWKHAVEEQKENNTDQIYVLSSFVLCDG
jgi:hypothetical protein